MKTKRYIFPLIIITIGAVALAKNAFGIEIDIRWEVIWPVLLIVWGASLLFNR